MTKVEIAEWDAFYKYGTFAKIERLKPMICESRFYYASPNQLNDPTDCRNIVQDHSEGEIEEFLLKANRQFYGDSRGDEYIRQGIKQFGPETLLEEMTKSFNKIMDTRYGVYSLAKRPNNMALWAKYADNHKGYCLEFSDISKFSNIYKVRYTKKLPLRLGLELDPTQADFLYTKSPEWSNEEEARILTKTPGYQVLPKGSLKSIIVGEHSNIENQQTISDWINECHANIVIKRAKFNGAKQKLEFLTI